MCAGLSAILAPMTYAAARKPADRVADMLRKRSVDRVPFTVYENKVEPGRAERELRNDGMCIVCRTPSFYRVVTPGCGEVTRRVPSNRGVRILRRVETAAGVLTTADVDRGDGQNAWHEEMPLKDQRDYPALMAYVADMRYEARYEGVRQRITSGGGDLFCRGSLGYSPMHTIIYSYMGVERFAYEWADNRKRVIALYEALCAKYEELCLVAAGAPNLAVNICGNVTASVVSPALFAEYYLPVYRRACDILHRGSRLAGVHFDGITFPFARGIAESGLDYVEALTPPPTCDVSVAKAHELWPDKAIWANFPSSVHLESEERIRRVARWMLGECRPERGFIMGVTEDVPADRWPTSFRIILEEVNGTLVQNAKPG